MADDTLLSRVPLPPTQVHRMPADADDLDAAGRAYALTLSKGTGARREEAPVLDLVWLGVGEDGHVASLFPGSPALHVADRWVVAVTDAPKPPPRRLTVTLPVLDAARRVVILASGAEKAEIVRAAIEGGPNAHALPAHAVATAAPGRLWLLDAAAAGALTKRR
jgi:6-phosphogluconolactonase